MADPTTGNRYPRNQPPQNTHGPVVQTGPTAGNNRARNKDGRWHKKRADAGMKRGPL